MELRMEGEKIAKMKEEGRNEEESKRVDGTSCKEEREEDKRWRILH